MSVSPAYLEATVNTAAVARHHFGEVEFIGSPTGGLQLDVANVLLAPNWTDAERVAGLDLLVDAVKYHLTSSYEDALQPDAAEALVAGLFANLSNAQGLDLLT
ncbi:hypothetical protein [Microvirga massiliensis]|uniref:hypothetical protein n=1 Tax=Microvirga massiliensis TaxID=1033741 RepID=UPI0007C7F2C7